MSKSRSLKKHVILKYVKRIEDHEAAKEPEITCEAAETLVALDVSLLAEGRAGKICLPLGNNVIYLLTQEST